MIGIYKIQSKCKPDRIYIGSSINIYKRWVCHISTLSNNKHRNIKLQRHYNKYGKCDLIFSIVILCNTEDLLQLEQYFIDDINPYFNICTKAGNTLGYRHTNDTKIKMKKPKSKEHKQKLSEVKIGKKTNRIPTNKFAKGYTPWNKGIKTSKSK